jgi:hypothetical protein
VAGLVIGSAAQYTPVRNTDSRTKLLDAGGAEDIRYIGQEPYSAQNYLKI